MRHLVSHRGYAKSIQVVSWFDRKRNNTGDHLRGEILVTILSQRERNPALSSLIEQDTM